MGVKLGVEDREERRSGWGGRRRRGQSREEGDEVGLGLRGQCVEPSLPASGFVGHGVGLSKQQMFVFLRKVESRQNFDKRKTEVGCQIFITSKIGPRNRGVFDSQAMYTSVASMITTSGLGVNWSGIVGIFTLSRLGLTTRFW